MTELRSRERADYMSETVMITWTVTSVCYPSTHAHIYARKKQNFIEDESRKHEHTLTSWPKVKDSVFLATAYNLQDLSSLTRDWSQALAVKVPHPNHWTPSRCPDIEDLPQDFSRLRHTWGSLIWSASHMPNVYHAEGQLIVQIKFVK